MTLRKLLDSDDAGWGDAYEEADRAMKIGVGIIIAIVVGIIVFVIVSVLICIYCVCKKRQASSGTVVQRGAPAPQVTTYSFQQGAPPQGMMQHPPPPPRGYSPGYPPAPGPPQPYPPPATAGGWTQPPPQPGIANPPPYTPQQAPIGFSEKQKASAPPME